MLVERDVQVLNVEVVGVAYDIAAHYLKQTGLIADSARIDNRLLELIYRLFDSGIRHPILLANKAIGKIERAQR